MSIPPREPQLVPAASGSLPPVVGESGGSTKKNVMEHFHKHTRKVHGSVNLVG